MVGEHRRRRNVRKTAEQRAIAALAARLRERDPHAAVPVLVIGDTSAELPPTVLRALRSVVHRLANGLSIEFRDVPPVVSAEQAANLLDIPRSYFDELVNEGMLAVEVVSGSKCVSIDELLAYKEQRDAERHAALIEMTRIGQELDALDQAT